MLRLRMMVGMIVVVLVYGVCSAEAVYPGPAPDTPGFVDGAERFDPEGVAQQLPYKPGEIIVKFKKAAAENIGRQLGNGKGAEALELSASLAKLNRRHKVKGIRPIFKNFKAKRQRMQGLLKKDKASLTNKEKRLLRRLKRAPKGAKVPDLGRIYKIELASGQSAARAAAAYNRDPDVEYAELNYVVSILVTEPNDPNYYPEQWALHNDGNEHPFERDPWDPNKGRFGGPVGTPDCDIDAPEAWDICTGSKDVTVAVLDTGVYYGHADIADNMWINTAEYNGDPNVDDDDNGYVDDIYGYDFCTFWYPWERDSDPNDDNGHGTHCAGIIAAAGNNGVYVTGINWDANIMALKFLSSSGYGYTADAEDAIDYAVDNGADIISNSWGSIGFSQSLKETFDYAVSQGLFIVAAAGNADDIWGIFPARYDSMMSVAATDHNDTKTSFSCYGDWIDVAAPGQDILSLRVPGKYNAGKWYPYNDPNAKMCVLSGTSMACPHVAGLAALCLAEDSNLGVDDLWVLIKNGCDDINDANLAAGRINAYTTVNYISSIPSPNQATSPYPANSATAITINAHLSWTADDWAASHDVYLGTSFNDVNDANTSSSVFKGNQMAAIFDPNTLSASTTYYWRIDERNYSATTKGAVWSFTTGADGPIYVDVDATGNNDGTSWANAFTDLHDGLAKAFDDDDIWVAEGTYKPHANDANVSFEPHEGVNLYGGFEANETDPNQRDPNILNDQSILSGDIGTGGDANDNSYHVVKIVGDNADSVLFDRFKVTAGNADLTPDFEAHGGGMFNFVCSVTLKDCLLADNYAILDGGAIFNRCASVTATNCTFSENKGYNGGGIGIYIGLPSGSSLTDCTFEKNDTGKDPEVSWRTGSGGGLHADYETVTVTDCTFADNNSLGSAGAIHIYGALEISGSTIEDNNSAYSYSCPGGIDCVGDLTMTDCNVTGNTNYGMYIWSLNASISDCEFSENDGIGIFVSSSQGTIENCTFDKNNGPGIKCNMYCGGMTIRNCLFTNNVNTSETNKMYHGGGISNSHHASCVIANCTFSKNSGVYGGAIYNYDSSPEVMNCVLWDNSATTAGDEIYNWVSDPNTKSADPNVTCSDVNGCGGSGAGWDPNFGTDCGGNIDEDPCFVDADSNDFHIDSNSLCVNAGDPNGDYSGQKDMDGEARVQAGRVDMGADETCCGVHNLNKDKWYSTIQGAIDDSSSNDAIELLPGTYYENVDYDGNAVTVRGTDPNDPNVVAATIIDGNGTGNVVTFNSSETSTSILEGLTIADGNRGIYCYYSSPTISKCVIKDNQTTGDGGGLYNDHADPNVLSCSFVDNEADDGGGMANYYGDPFVLGCTFTGNDADNNGGAIHNEASSPTITNCTFSNNECDDEGGGIRNNHGSNPVISDCTFTSNSAPDKGGGISNRTNCHPTLTNCVFSGNSANYYGGGMQNESNCDPTVTDCIFTGNSARDGAGMYNDDYSDPTLTGCIFSGNAASDDGGGMWNRYSSPEVNECVFSNNVADSSGGGMYCSKSSASPRVISCVFAGNTGYYGGGMSNWDAVEVTVVNCLFYNNTGHDGGGMFNEDHDYEEAVIVCCTFFENDANDDGGAVYHEDSSPLYSNCILWDNEAVDDGNEVYIDSGSDPEWEDCDIEGCGGSDDWDSDCGDDDGGNIDEDPNFVGPTDPNGTDDNWANCDDGLRLNSDSPCVDEGDDYYLPNDIDTDIKGSDREIGSDVDMGAYEYDSGC